MIDLRCGDALSIVKTLDDQSIDCVITSPPYWQLRDYGYPEQWGLEPTFEEYLQHLWSLMDEIWRVLKPSGTVWVNLGDTYGTMSGAMRDGKFGVKNINNQKIIQPKSIHKCLLLIPHRFGIGCIDRGWIVRNDIVWGKRNGMPESIEDRFSKKHEYFFFMVKQAKYDFNLESIKDPQKIDSVKRYLSGNSDKNKNAFSNGGPGNSTNTLNKPRDYKGYGDLQNEIEKRGGKNPGDVSDFWEDYKTLSLEEYLELCTEYYFSEDDFWDIPTKPSKEKHYAAYNRYLIDKPIKAGCPEGGIILDPFCGTATTGERAIQLGRSFIGIDGSKEYIKAAENRIMSDLIAHIQ